MASCDGNIRTKIIKSGHPSSSYNQQYQDPFLRDSVDH